MQKQQQRDASVASSASSAFLGASQNERNECNFKHVLTASASSAAAAAAAAALCFIDRDRKARRKRNRRKQQLHATAQRKARPEATLYKNYDNLFIFGKIMLKFDL